MKTAIGCVLGVLLLIVISGCERGGPVFLETTSPGRIYSVAIAGLPTRPGFPPVEHTIRVAVRRAGTGIVSAFPIHSADWFDSAFSDDYASHEWPRENVLRFISRNARCCSTDILVLRNEADHVVAFLHVESADMLVMFDIPGRSEIRLKTTGRTDYAWVGASGLWQDGTPIQHRGANFSNLQPGVSNEFAIVVNERGISVHRQ